MADPTIRIATVDDAEAIRSIYNVEVESSTVTFDIIARTLDDQRRWIVDRSGAHVALVALDGDDGGRLRFAVALPIRPAYATTVEDSVYVHRDHQGRGVGRALLSELVDVWRPRTASTRWSPGSSAATTLDQPAPRARVRAGRPRA